MLKPSLEQWCNAASDAASTRFTQFFTPCYNTLAFDLHPETANMFTMVSFGVRKFLSRTVMSVMSQGLCNNDY